MGKSVLDRACDLVPVVLENQTPELRAQDWRERARSATQWIADGLGAQCEPLSDLEREILASAAEDAAWRADSRFAAL